jgi:uncharacterized membrane protein
VGIDSGIYKALLVLHILAAIVGFGSVFLNGIHGVQAKKRGGREGLAIADSAMAVGNVSEKVIYAVFLLGVALVVTSDDVWSFGDLWVSVSMALFIVAVGLSHGMLMPNLHRMRELMATLAEAGAPGAAGGPPPQAVELEQRGRTVGIVSGVLNLMVVVILALMVWKPT